MPPPSASAVASAQQRIITHMNAQHRLALSHYLRHYARLPASLSSTAQLTNITLGRLTLSVRHANATSSVHIPLDPPMADYADARARLEAMATEAKRGLGIVETWTWNIEGVVTAVGVVSGLVCFWDAERWLGTGGWIRVNIFPWLPSFVDLFLAYGAFIWWIILGIHVVECVYVHHSRLGEHGINTGNRLWWMWIASVFFEGYPAIKRFDREVRRIRGEED